MLTPKFCTTSYVTCSGKSLHLRTKSEFNFIAQDNSYTKDLSIATQCLYCPMLTGLLFWRALFRPCDVTVKRMAPWEGTSWGAMG